MVAFLSRLLRRLIAVGILVGITYVVYSPIWLAPPQPASQPVIFHLLPNKADTRVLEVFTLPRSDPVGRHR